MQETKDIYSRINNICLVIIAGGVLMGALYVTKNVLIPFVFSLFIYAVASPIIAWFQKRLNLPHWAAISITLLIYLLASFFLWLIIFVSIQDFFQSANVYGSRIEDFIQWITERALNWGYPVDASTAQEYIRKLPFFTVAKNLTGSAFLIVGNIILIIIFTIFLITGGSVGQIKNNLIIEIQEKVSNYVVTKFIVSAITGVIVWVILAACQVELAFMFGMSAVLLNFIPNIGSLIATALPLPVVLLQYGVDWHFFTVLITTGTTQFTIGNILEPKMLGETMDLHPVAVLLFLVFWGLVWGLPGMFLAVPITAILKIILCRIETTRPLAELLAGRLPE